MKSKKLFKEADIRKMLGYVIAEQMTFGRMVELLNEDIDKACDQDTELAKSEMREIAIDAHWRSCLNYQSGMCIKNYKIYVNTCEGKCPYMTFFTNVIGNPKTE